MKIDLRQFAILMLVVVSSFISSCSRPGSGDSYIDSLGLDEIVIEPAQSINLEDWNILKVNSFAVFGDWVAIRGGDKRYAVSLLNLQTGENFGLAWRGRGPGEFVNPIGFDRKDSTLIIYDAASKVMVSIDIHKSSEKRIPVYDTLLIASPPVPPILKPHRLKSGMYITSAFSEEDHAWYGLRDSTGYLVASVLAPNFEPLQNMDANHYLSFVASSLYTSHPSGKKVCVASLMSAAISFSGIEENDLKEYHREEYNPPQIKNTASGTRMEGFTDGFEGLQSNDKYVYALYSGKKVENLKDDIAQARDCDYLIVYDWDADPVYLFRLQIPAYSISLSGDKLYALSNNPNLTMHIYKMPDFTVSR